MRENREQGAGSREQGAESRAQSDLLAKSEMTAFEREAAKAFAARRVEAPVGFADRVMARVEATERPVSTKQERGRFFVMSPRWRTWAAGAIAAVIVAGVLQADRVHQQHERRAEAQRQFETAQRITDEALAHMREQLRTQGIDLGR